MQEAVSAVSKGIYSIRQAAGIFDVNKSMLHDTMTKGTKIQVNLEGVQQYHQKLRRKLQRH